MACNNKQTTQEVVEDDLSNQTKTEKKSTEMDKKVILCFGNSLTAGYGLQENEAWPSLLQEKIDSLGSNYKVINAGLSGETTSGGANRIDWVLNQKVDIFILELGANDMLRGLDVDQTKINLNKILERVKASYPNCKVILAGMQSPPNMGPAYEKAFNAIYPSLATEYNAELIPFFLEGVATVESLNLPDGKHPNAEGQKRVLENVWNVLKPMIE